MTENSGDANKVKLTERLVIMAIQFAVGQNGLCYWVLDAFFSVGSVFRVCQYYAVEYQQAWIHVVAKAKDNDVGLLSGTQKAGFSPRSASVVRRKICLKECFDHPHLFETPPCNVYGKTD